MTSVRPRSDDRVLTRRRRTMRLWSFGRPPSAADRRFPHGPQPSTPRATYQLAEYPGSRFRCVTTFTDPGQHELVSLPAPPIAQLTALAMTPIGRPAIVR